MTGIIVIIIILRILVTCNVFLQFKCLNCLRLSQDFPSQVSYIYICIIIFTIITLIVIINMICGVFFITMLLNVCIFLCKKLAMPKIHENTHQIHLSPTHKVHCEEQLRTLSLLYPRMHLGESHKKQVTCKLNVTKVSDFQRIARKTS